MKKTNECTTIIIKFSDFGKTSVEQTSSSEPCEEVSCEETPCDDDTIDPVGKIDNFANHILNIQKALVGTIENEPEEEEITSPFTDDGNITHEEDSNLPGIGKKPDGSPIPSIDPNWSLMKPEEIQENEIEEDELIDDKTGQQFDEEDEEELIVQDNNSIIYKFNTFLEKKNEKDLPDKYTDKNARKNNRKKLKPVKLIPSMQTIKLPKM